MKASRDDSNMKKMNDWSVSLNCDNSSSCCVSATKNDDSNVSCDCLMNDDSALFIFPFQFIERFYILEYLFPSPCQQQVNVMLKKSVIFGTLKSEMRQRGDAL